MQHNPDDQPKHVKRAKKRRYGFEEWSDHFNKWTHARWFATERARDQALEAMERKTVILKQFGLTPRYRKVKR